MYGDTRDALSVVDRVAEGLNAATERDHLIAGVLEGIVESFRLAGASIDVTSTGRLGTIVAGQPGGLNEVALPLVIDDQFVGMLTAWPRPGERLDHKTRRALDAVVPMVGVAALLTIKVDELAESRVRLVEARDEERRAIRSELHDGLGPALAGVGYGLQGVLNLLDTNPVAATDLLRRLVVEIDARVDEIRTMARDLIPPALIDGGLVAALEELATRHSHVGLDIVLDISAEFDISVPMATTIYGFTSEALRNVIRHADASTCRIGIRQEPAAVSVTVTDDGIGYDPQAPSGVGLQSMRERAAALGGTATIEPGPSGGTVVRVWLPIERRVPA